MEKDTHMTENSQDSDTISENAKETNNKDEKTEHWDGVLTIDPLTVRRIIEANKLVDDLEEEGEL